jgi:2-hydroxy-3-oxopropionate reductase
MRIGFCGTGLMGAPMVLRLIEAGHEVHVWNRSKDKLGPLVAAGARIADTPAAVTIAAEVIGICLFDIDAVEETVFGVAGIASCRGATTLIDHSSISPEKTRLFSARAAAAAAMDWIDAPVSGGAANALTGTLTIMVGGSVESIARARQMMQAYAARITHMGPVGSGQAAKLCNQTIVASTIAAIAEAVALARNSGLDPEKLPEALKGGAADSPLLPIFVPRMVKSPSTLLSTITTMLKDIDSVWELARQTGTPIPVASAVHQVFRLAKSLGFGAADISAISRVYERRLHGETHIEHLTQ